MYVKTRLIRRMVDILGVVFVRKQHHDFNIKPAQDAFSLLWNLFGIPSKDPRVSIYNYERQAVYKKCLVRKIAQKTRNKVDLR